VRPIAIAAGALLLAWCAFGFISWTTTKETIGAGILGLVLMAYGFRRSWE
jgi:hypothetical protein